jgi:hypothetical protein
MANRRDEPARWIVPRPAYKSETESDQPSWAWRNPADGGTVDPEEQKRNRQLFMARASRKRPSNVQADTPGANSNDELKTG